MTKESPFDAVRNAEARGNANKATKSNQFKIQRTDKQNNNKNKVSHNNTPTSYRSLRASTKVVNEYQALQYITKDKTRSDIMQRAFDIAKKSILDTPQKKDLFKKHYTALQILNK